MPDNPLDVIRMALEREKVAVPAHPHAGMRLSLYDSASRGSVPSHPPTRRR